MSKLSLPLIYHVIPKSTTKEGAELYLTANVGNKTKQVTVDTLNSTSAQEWTLIPWLTPDGYLGNLLFNPASNSVLIAPKNKSSVTLVDYAKLQLEIRAGWNIYGDTNDYGAIQLSKDTKMNLNVLGAGPHYQSGSEVGAWSWSNGQNNEIWEFQLKN